MEKIIWFQKKRVGRVKMPTDLRVEIKTIKNDRIVFKFYDNSHLNIANSGSFKFGLDKINNRIYLQPSTVRDGYSVNCSKNDTSNPTLQIRKNSAPELYNYIKINNGVYKLLCDDNGWFLNIIPKEEVVEDSINKNEYPLIFYTEKQVSDMLQLGKTQTHALFQTDGFPAIRIGRDYRVEGSAFKKWYENTKDITLNYEHIK